jgi:hypothetical protein
MENDGHLMRYRVLDDSVGNACMAMNFSNFTLRYVDDRIQLHNVEGPHNPGLSRACLAIANGGT